MRFFLIAMFFLIGLASTVWAQEEIAVRGGEHEGYTRLVFDMGRKVDYEIKSSEGSFSLSFKAPGAFDFDGIKKMPLSNVLELKSASGANAQLSVSIPKGARVRDFLVGSRVVVDVYAPPGFEGASAVPKIRDLSEGEALESEVKDQTGEVSQNAKMMDVQEAPAQTSLEKARDAIREILQKDVEVDVIGRDRGQQDGEGGDTENLDSAQSSHLQKLREDLEKIGENLISVSSTTASGLAVFRKDGEIWMVNDQPEVLISPQVSGPEAQLILPVRREDFPEGKIFRANDLGGAFLRVQGGGLVWRVIVSGAKKKSEPVKPIREGIIEGVSRGASIVWPFKQVKSILDVRDPISGRVMKIVVASKAKEHSGPELDFVDFKVFESAAGMAILPKVDDLQVTKTEEGVEITRPAGLALSDPDRVSEVFNARMEEIKDSDPKAEKKVFNLANWKLGTIEELRENQNIILATLPGLTVNAQVEGILTLSKMFLAHGFWAEALGFAEYAERTLPELSQNPEFVAIKGAALALGFNSEKAFQLLSSPKLDEFDEIGYWRAHVLSDLGDWQQAAEVLPQSTHTLSTYPENVVSRLGLGVAEVALRSGNVDYADKVLAILEPYVGDMFFEQKAALDYLKGEAARQKNDVKKAKEYWEPLIEGKDDLYRAKAGLALTRLEMEDGELDVAQSIDTLERLRYAWRGDEIEAQINYWLGRTYFDAGAYVKGLNIMREAASFVAGLDLGRRITKEMTDIFTALLMDPDPEKLPPLDAAALYEQFAELVPTGPRGDQVVKSLAEHLVSGEVLGRAAQLLQYQVDHRLKGAEAYETAVRLSAIYLLDNQVKEAAEALNKANSIYKKLPENEQTKDRELEQNLLKARTLSGLERADQAIELLRSLPSSRDVNRLWAGIAWKAGYWDDAAEALHDVITDQNISLTRPLSDENAMLILQRAVALNLASDRVGLANLREKYTQVMEQTDKARLFEVVTRPRQSAALADRETLMSIVSEVDLFADFLNSYKNVTKPLN